MGTAWACRNARGSPPARASLRFSNAASRTSARLTSCTLPKPMSWRLPWTVRRCIHCLLPPRATRRNSVAPSPCIPGRLMLLTFSAVSLGMVCPTFCHTPILGPCGGLPHVLPHAVGAIVGDSGKRHKTPMRK